MPSASAYAERTQHVDHKPMANAHALRKPFPFFGEEHTPIRPRCCEPRTLEALNRLDRGGVRNAEAPGDVGRPCLA
jgi:hypothetical protein